MKHGTITWWNEAWGNGSIKEDGSNAPVLLPADIAKQSGLQCRDGLRVIFESRDDIQPPNAGPRHRGWTEDYQIIRRQRATVVGAE